MPCSTQLAGNGVPGAAVVKQEPLLSAVCVMASKFADWRVRLVKLTS